MPATTSIGKASLQFTFTLAIWTMLATFAEQGDSSGQGVLEARFLWGRELLQIMKLGWQIGDRNTTRVFLDPWTPRPLSFKVGMSTCSNPNVMDMDVEVIRGIPVNQFVGDD
ncbi:hypothetical protein TIFTF001_038016 [Ficus carica]|uniref:Uncharacterized protein n=1 Tax=Ficus carica TaxID=3494 RepID=A0AA88JCF5_FICCA|nr:hypothetical protein TIFTF001_038016 [Ficus carica]